MWLSEGRVSLAAGRLRQGVEQGVSKDALRGFVDEDYESTVSYNQKTQLVDGLRDFIRALR
jgi:5-methylcytosine-specific restriction protein B